MNRCLAAFTAFDPIYPPYLNVSTTDDGISVTLRPKPIFDPGNADAGPICGNPQQIEMTHDQFAEFLATAILNCPDEIWGKAMARINADADW